MFNKFDLDDLSRDDFVANSNFDDITLDDDNNSIKDNEGAMLKADLFKLANYSYKLFKKINDEDQFEAWVQAKVTKAADYIASVYHYIEYEMKFSEYGKKLDDSEMYTESQKLELKKKLLEAKEKIAQVKIAQANKKSKLPRKKLISNKVTDELAETKEKPSSGMTKSQKSSLVKNARAGKDIGRPGKGFSKVEKAAEKSSAKNPKAVAASAMWKAAKKNALKESTLQGVPSGDMSSEWPIDADESFDDQSSPKLTYNTSIPNPSFDDTDETSSPEIDVTVTYSISGQNIPTSYNDPGEQTEVEIHNITNDETGETIEVSDTVYDQLVDEILNQSSEYDDDYYNDNVYKEEQSPRRSRRTDNFTADDINQLDRIRDLDEVKQRAIELISTKSARTMKPEKIEWFTREIQEKTNKAAIVKLMYDLLLSGEGLGVIGTKTSMNPNSYRTRFGESLTESADLDSILKLAGLQKL